MKKLFFILLVGLTLSNMKAFSQGECLTGGCSNFNSNYPSTTQSTTSSVWDEVSTLIYAGEYAYYSVVSGETYEWSLLVADGGLAGYDSRLTLWNSTGTTAYCSSDDYSGDDAKISWTATFTGTVRVLISYYQNATLSCQNNTTATTLVWRCSSCGAATGNDDCADAVTLTSAVACNYTSGDVSYSTGTAWQACSGESTSASADDVWFSFVATGTAHEITVDPSASFDAVFEVLEDGCTLPTRIKCVDGSAVDGGLENTVVSGLTIGDTYWVRVYDYWDTDPTTTTFDICVQDFVSGTPTEGDCLGAIKVCEDTYSYSNTVSGIGNIADLGVASECGTYEKNSTWYTFNVETDGDFMFTLYSSVDYDWALYDLSGVTSCEDIFDGSITSIRCNFSVTAGNTGMSLLGTNDNEGTTAGAVWCNPLTVTAGQSFALLVDNYNGGAVGYDLDFGTGTAGIFDNDPPYLQQITSAPACGENTITFDFNEVVLASSVGIADFTVTQGANTYTITNVVGVNGTTNDQSYTITLNTALTQGGSYSLNLVDDVTDACSNTVLGNSLSFTVTGVSISLVDLNDAICYNGSNGSVQVLGTGGTAPYTYNWAPNGFTGDGTATYSGLSAGTYNITVTDNIGACNATATYTVDDGTAISGTAVLTHVLCRGNSTGAINLTPSGGSGTYSSYLWSNGATTQDISSLAAGSYSVTITDNLGCTSSAVSFTINQPATVLSASAVATDVTCNGANDGEATVTASGGTGAISYNWAPNGFTGDGTATYSNLDGGTYSVSVSDANSCQVVLSGIVVDEPNAITATVTDTDVSCNGDNDGAISTSSVSGGTGSYTYQWSTVGGSGIVAGASSQIVLTAGTYNLTITDGNSCTYTNLGISITQPNAIAFTVTPSSATCGATNGSATVSGVSGGNGVYSYAWSSSANTTATESNLAANSYTVTVSDGNACFLSKPFSVGSLSGPTVTATLVSNATCYGYSNGSATATPSGGTGTIDYLWSNGQTIATATTLPSGIASVTITDDNSCTATTTILITQPNEMVIATSGSTLDCNGDNNGTATVSVNGGTAPYDYEWTPGADTYASASSTNTISGLSAGTYTVTVTDVNNCTALLVAPPITSCFEITDILVNSCGGTQEGLQEMVTFNVGSSAVNTSTLVIDWPSNSWQGVCTDPTFVANTNATITGGGALIEPIAGSIPAGAEVLVITSTDLDISAVDFTTLDHNVYVVFQCAGNTIGHFGNTDVDPLNGRDLIISFGGSCGADTVTYYPFYLPEKDDGDAVSFSYDGGWSTYNNGCMAPLASTTVAEVIEPSVVTATTSAIDATCYNGADGEATVTPSGGIPPYDYDWDDVSFQTTATASGLSEGTYNVTVTDDNGCEAYYFETISEPAQIILTTDSTLALCGGSDGTATVSVVSGGVGSFDYDWAGTPAGDGTATITALAVGSYTVTATDDNNCTATATATVTASGAPTVSLVVNNHVSCFNGTDGSITATGAGGTGTYTFVWSPAGYTETTVSPNSTYSDLENGTYFVTINDGLCTASGSILVTEPTVLTASITSSQNVSCYNGSDGTATVSVSGGTPFAGPVYTYAWPLGNTTASVSNLSDGNSIVTVTDAEGCTTTATAVITEPAELVATATGTDVLCNGGTSGTASVAVSGGTTPYGYVWSSGSSSVTALNLSVVGSPYGVTVTDAEGCQATGSVTINQPTALFASATANDASAFGVCDGDATVSVASGGVTPYTYAWPASTGSQTGVTAINLCDGTYVVTLTDANSCTTTATVTVNEPSSLSISTTTTPPLCNASSEGTATVTISGGVSPYDVTWSSGDSVTDTTGLSHTTTSGLTAGTYTVTVVDANGISVNTSAIVTAPTAISSFVTVTNATCFGDNDGEATVNAPSGGTPGYTYAWSSSAGTAISESNLLANSYFVTIFDANSCELVLPFTITQPTELVASISSHNDVSCNGDANGSAIAAYSGGPVGATTYTWSPSGGTAPTASGLSGGTYTITINKGACSDTAMVVISEPTPLVTGILDTDISCNAAADGEIAVSVSGGTTPYTYTWATGQVTATITNLSPNTYTVTVLDANSCESILSATITQPNALNITNTKTNVSCFGGNDGIINNVIVSGGTTPYSYLWSTLDGSGLIPAQANQSGLIEGTYSLTVTDANLCTAIISVVITEPSELQASLTTSNNVSCFGANDANVNITVIGGTSPYIYSWSSGFTGQDLTNVGPNTYAVTVTDDNGCQDNLSGIVITEPNAITIDTLVTDVACRGGNTGAIDITVIGGTGLLSYSWTGPTAYTNNIADITGLYAGSYYLTVTDGNACQSVLSNISVLQPAANLLASINPISVACYGDIVPTVDLLVSGGTAPYTYLWGGSQTTQDLTNVLPATYSVTVTDSHSCTTNTSVTVSEPTELTATATVTDVLCNGASTGQISVLAVGGTGSYQYTGTNSIISPNLTAQLAGTYNITVTDANSCQFTFSETITEPTAIVLDTTIVNSTCNNNNGSATIHALGGVDPYTYFWENTTTDSTITGVTSGTYDVQVTDANGCIETMSVDISDAGAPTITVNSSTNVDCNGNDNGAITITVTGGASPYTYLWSTATGSGLVPAAEDQSGLSGGTYSLNLTDDNSCSATASVVILEPAVLSLTYTATDVDCNGNATGAVNLTVIGGTTPYIYNWNAGTYTTQDLSSIPAGTYSVLVTDANSCTETTSIVVNEPVVLSASITTYTDATGAGICDGTATVTVTDGTAPYTYLWTNGQTTVNSSGLCDGTHYVTVTDANGCTEIASILISEPSSITLSTSVVNVRCNGLATGDIDLTVSGGVSPYTYSWTGGYVTQDITNVIAGTYQVTVEDANGYFAYTSAIITQPLAISAQTNVTDVLCNGDATGSIDVYGVTGGISPYIYNWDNGALTQDLNSVLAGTYELTITDDSLCTFVVNEVISEPATVVTATHTLVDVKCFGMATGSISMLPSGGTPSYSYSWSNGATSQSVNGLVAGAYDVTVYDSHLCEYSETITISEPLSGLSVASINSTDVLCNGGSTGAVEITVSGGTSPFDFEWSNGNLNEDISNIIAGTYSVTVTDSLNCEAYASIVVNQPDSAIIIAIDTIINTACGSADGAAYIDVAGGTSPYTYAWTGGISTTDSITAQFAGNYFVTVTDANACFTVKTISISNSDAHQISISASENVTCFGSLDGSASVIITLLSTPAGTYTYEWQDEFGTIVSLLDSAVNLSGGDYSVTVTDGSGCEAVESVTINEPNDFIATATAIDAECYGEPSGRVYLSVVGGTLPYSFAWDNGAIIQNISTLLAGTYSVVVTDDNGCTANANAIVGQPLSPFVVTETITDVSCNNFADGSIGVVVSGENGGYTYNWTNGNNNDTIVGLTDGNYSVLIQDLNGCDTTLTYSISEPSNLNIFTNSTEVLCAGGSTGSATVSALGGTAPYTYLWNDVLAQITDTLFSATAGTYDVVVTDDNGCTATSAVSIIEPDSLTITIVAKDIRCKGDKAGAAYLVATGGKVAYSYNWENSLGVQIGTSSDIFSLFPGTYYVTVTDGNGCQVSDNVIVSEPDSAVDLSITAINVSCNGGSDAQIDLEAFGGTPGYTYYWNYGQTTEDISGLQEGRYSVTVFDSFNCMDTISIDITEPLMAINLSSTNIDASCGSNNGSATVIPVGGTSPYTYAWSNGGNTATISNLAAANYVVTVTDTLGCSRTLIVTVDNDGYPTLVQTSSSMVSCYGVADASATVFAAGGVNPYSYLWENGSNNTTASGLAAGVHSVTVTDGNGCVDSLDVTIVQPDSLQASIIINAAMCYGSTDGSIALDVEGGTAPYTYLWASGEITYNLLNISAGTYVATITDSKGCTAATQTITITEPSGPLVVDTALVSSVSCYEGYDGEIALTVSGGTSPYAYAWAYGATTATVDSLVAGFYKVTITDANGCTFLDTVEVQEPTQIVLDWETKATTCGFDNGEIYVISITGGTAPYNWLWSTGVADTDTLSGLPFGDYSIVITDANSCVNQFEIEIQTVGNLNVYPNTTQIQCFKETGSIIANVPAAIPPVSYLWSNGNISQSITGLIPGIYTVDVIDSIGCEGTATVTILPEPSQISISVSPSNITCNGANDGTAEVFVSGGTPYSSEPHYTYVWTDADTSTTAAVTNLEPNVSYMVYVSDENGCTESQEVILTQPEPLTISIDSISNVKCFGGSDGEIVVNAIGGTDPYKYRWSNGGKFNAVTGIEIGTYVITVTDLNDCEATATIEITEPEIIEISNVTTATSCQDSKDGSAEVAAIGGTVFDDYTYLWNDENATTTSTIDNLGAGDYYVTITDDNACEMIDTVTIEKTMVECLEIPNCITPNDDGFNDEFVITNIELYENSSIEIYNRWGELIFEHSGGYFGNEWDGTYQKNGNDVPMGSYVYILKFSDDSDPKTGVVSVIR